MSAIEDENPPDVNIGGILITLEWTLAGIAAIILGLRFFTVAAILRRIRITDWIMLLAFICGIVQGAMLTESYRWGLGRHVQYLTYEQQTHAVKYLILLMGWGICCMTFGRISFCLFMLSFVPSRNAMWMSLWFFISAQLFVNLFTIAIVYVQCGRHLEALWDPHSTAQCWDPLVQRNISYFQCAFNAFTDLCLTVLPAILLKGLYIDFAKKAAVTSLLSLSFFAFVASVVKTVKIDHLSHRGDFTWTLTDFHYWAVAENWIIIIAASVPLLNAMIKRRRESASNGIAYRLSATRARSAFPSQQPQVWTRIEAVETPQRSVSGDSKAEIVVIDEFQQDRESDPPTPAQQV